jgi:hypothetical protein
MTTHTDTGPIESELLNGLGRCAEHCDSLEERRINLHPCSWRIEVTQTITDVQNTLKDEPLLAKRVLVSFIVFENVIIRNVR